MHKQRLFIFYFRVGDRMNISLAFMRWQRDGLEETSMAKVHTGADVKRQFKPLAEADIEAYSDDASFRNCDQLPV